MPVSFPLKFHSSRGNSRSIAQGLTPRSSVKSPGTGTAGAGASAGIGLIYADRLARRGYDLILVARNEERLNLVAARLFNDSGCSVQTIVADLSEKADVAQVEQMLSSDESINLLINNAGIGAPAQLLDSEIERLTRMIGLNVTALVRLTSAGICKSNLVVRVTQVLVDHTDNDLASGSARRRILDG